MLSLNEHRPVPLPGLFLHHGVKPARAISRRQSAIRVSGHGRGHGAARGGGGRNVTAAGALGGCFEMLDRAPDAAELMPWRAHASERLVVSARHRPSAA